MKTYLIFAIYLYLIKNKRTTASLLSKKFEISTRSIYRYIDTLSLLGVPIITKLGRNGGIEIVGEHYIEGLVLSKKDKEIITNFIQENKDIEQTKDILKRLI